ncbi:MAG: SurA N-terminal domain-containing protein [Verrucomicrobiales bacterium]
MFSQIRRHQKWLWILISSLVIVSFVWYFNPNAGAGGGPQQDNDVVGTLGGEPISRSQYVNTLKEAQLWYLFRFQEWPQDNDFYRQMGRPVERHLRERLVLIKRLNDLGIKVSDEAVGSYIFDFFKDRETKTFRKEYVDNFVNQQLAPRGIRRVDFERFVRHELGIQHLVQLAGSPGKLITPQEAEMVYRQENRKADVKFVSFPTSNYLAQVQINPDALATFFTNRAAIYRVPERIQLSYVAFPATNYLAVADQRLNAETNLNLQIDQLYAQRGTNFYTDATGVPLSPEAAKAKIREEARLDIALTEAQRAANEFTQKLMDMPLNTNSPNASANLETLAGTAGLPVQMTEPFTESEGPRGLNVPAQFSRVAFELSKEQPILEESIRGEDAVYVISFKNRFASEVPELETVRAQVENDYRRTEAARLAREAGSEFARKAREAGANFEELAKGAGYAVTDLQPFTQADRGIEGIGRVDEGSVKNIAFALKEGEVSNYVSGRDAGFVLQVERFVLVNDADLTANLATFTESLRRARTTEAFQAWFQNEMESANLRLAGDEEQKVATQ